jgi:hypothetical protein
MSIDKEIKYVAQVEPVREVSLIGSADLAYWTSQLAADNLRPIAFDGQARVMIGATAARFLGIQFREVTITVLCRPLDDAVQEGYFLAQAFNSVRWFAWVERNLFSTPYDHAAIEVDTSSPAALRLKVKDETLVAARLAAENLRHPGSIDDFAWAGPVFLPRGTRKVRKFFWAKIAGETRNYPFDAERDVLELRRSVRQPVIASLIESQFVAREWAVREAAAHAKSKTYRRAPADSTASQVSPPAN